MSLEALLLEKGIRSALIVDDVFDRVPKASDIGVTNEEWSIFIDDLQAEQKDEIVAKYPQAETARADELIADDGYVATLWEMRERLGEGAERLFESYIADQEADDAFARLAREKLEALGLVCETEGREFETKAATADLIVIDLFFGTAQDEAAMNTSKQKLRSALAPRASDPPLVILMSRSPRLSGKRDEFRDEVGLLDSAFRIIQKSDLHTPNRLERQIERLVENVRESKRLAAFFHALKIGMSAATERTLLLLRRLRLSDIGQIQELLLSVEGESTGSYLVDIFDGVLQHEIERDRGIIDAALALNAFAAANHPPPYVAGSADLQQLVQRLLSQNAERLRMSGAQESALSFGDILQMRQDADPEELRRSLLVGIAADKVLLVLTPACDLQREGVPRILLLVGTLKHLGAKDWSYGPDARTPAILVDGVLQWIKWDLKHIDTVAQDAVQDAIDRGEIRVVARLRNAHALELQQRVLSGLGRVGLVARLPATFPVMVEAYYANSTAYPARLDVPALNDGAVCFVGRDEKGNQVLRLVLTEGSCDGILEAVTELSEEDVADASRAAFRHVRDTTDLRRLLSSGIDLNSVGPKNWTAISSLTDTQRVPKLGLIAWNHPGGDALGKDTRHAGIILIVRDANLPDAPGLDEARKMGYVAPADGDLNPPD